MAKYGRIDSLCGPLVPVLGKWHIYLGGVGTLLLTWPNRITTVEVARHGCANTRYPRPQASWFRAARHCGLRTEDAK